MIKAKIIADAIGPTNVRITTFELEYPRFIHSELMTHRVFSRNAASSRAIPIEKMIQTIRENPAAPIHWGKNQPGMQAQVELDEITKQGVKSDWNMAMEHALFFSESMHLKGAHKQIANRITETFQHMKVLVTATEFNNWFWLRNHPDAQPEIHELANQMQIAYNSRTPQFLHAGMWYLPFVKCIYDYSHGQDDQFYVDENDKSISLDEAKMISASCCAQVSYRKSDGSLEKAEVIYKKLIESEPCHASPVEHQAQAFDFERGYNKSFEPDTWSDGITHVDRNGNLWSGNLRGWIQLRQLISNNVRKG